MAGERYAKLTLRAAWSFTDQLRARQTQEVRFKLYGQTRTYRRGANSANREFVVPDPSDISPAPGRPFVQQGLSNLLDLVRRDIFVNGLSYTISALRDVGDDLTVVNTVVDGSYETGAWPIIEFDITANVYDRTCDLDFSSISSTGFTIVSNVTTIRPVNARADVVNATIFGAADGSITIVASNGNDGVYTYAWDDPAAGNTAVRTNLKAGTYTCTITDTSGASTVVRAVVLSDPKFEVAVNSTDTTIELVATGGLPPYTYQWDDGATTPTRTGLKAGTYRCLVSEGRGLVKEIVVTLSPYLYHWSENAITLSLDAGQAYRDDPATKPNLSFLCEVWVEHDYRSGVFEQVGITLEQPADALGRTTFEVQALLQVFLKHHVPAPGQTGLERADALFRRFLLKHAEQFGEEPVRGLTTSLERRFVVLGGLDFYEARARTWFTDYQPTKLPFLTWEPATKYVLADQPEYLYYMVQQSPARFEVQLRVHFSDGTEQELALASQDAPTDFEVYCLPVGYQALGLAALTATTPDRRLAWWEVWVATGKGGDRLSETRRFVLDPKAYPHRRYFLYATSLGGMATYAALGEAQLDTEVTGEETTLTLRADYDVLLGDTAVQQRQLRPLVKVAAGKRTRAELEVSRDLLLSSRVLLLQGKRWLPGYLKAKTSTLLDESKLVQVQEFEFYLPAERRYTPSL